MSERRLLLKISGEVLGGVDGRGIDPATLTRITGEVARAATDGVQIGLVVGGGNFLRGASLTEAGIGRVSGDQMGMLATVMNGLALREGFDQHGIDVPVVSAIPAGQLVEAFSAWRVDQHLRSVGVVILVGGTGNPYFTTDTCASLRALEIRADALLKGTKVDGIYSADPVADPSAERYEEISYEQVIAKRLAVMDLAAFEMCREHRLPIRVFDMVTPGNIERALKFENLGSIVWACQ